MPYQTPKSQTAEIQTPGIQTAQNANSGKYKLRKYKLRKIQTCVNLRKTESITQNVNLYSKHAIVNWPKLTVSAQNQTIEGLLKNLYTK